MLRAWQECAWVGLGQVEGNFRPNPLWWVKKIQPITEVQPNPLGLGWVRLNPSVGQFLFLFFITIIIKLSKKNISHLLPKLINKIFMNQYSNLVIKKIYMNQYPNSIINKLEWSGRVRVGGGRVRNKIVRVCEAIRFYIGSIEQGEKLNKKFINYIIYF